jgi:hypothetical protein
MDKEFLNEESTKDSKCCCDNHENDVNEECSCEGHGDGHDDGCGCGEHEHGCDCGCGENENLIVELEDENGNVVPCEVVDSFEYKDNEFVIVQNPEDSSVYLFKVVGEGEEGELVIPEDEEFEEVSAYYKTLTESDTEDDTETEE